MAEKVSGGLLVKARPFGVAERIYRRLVDRVRMVDSALEADIDAV